MKFNYLITMQFMKLLEKVCVLQLLSGKIHLRSQYMRKRSAYVDGAGSSRLLRL